MGSAADRSWIVPGAAVALLTERLHGDGGSIIRTTIERVTKRDVVLSNGTRLRVANPTINGRTWGPSTDLLPADHERVLRASLANRRRSAVFQVSERCDEFRREPTTESADALIAAVTEWKKLTDG